MADYYSVFHIISIIAIVLYQFCTLFHKIKQSFFHILLRDLLHNKFQMKVQDISETKNYQNHRLRSNHYVIKNGKLVPADLTNKYEPNNRWVPHQLINKISPEDYFSNTVKTLHQELKATKQELQRYQNQSLEKRHEKTMTRVQSLDNMKLLNIIKQKDEQLKQKSQQLKKANQIIHCLEKKQKSMNEVLVFKQKLIKQQQQSMLKIIKKQSIKEQKKKTTELAVQTDQLRKSNLISKNKSILENIREPLGQGNKNTPNMRSTQASDQQLGQNLKSFSKWALTSKRVSFISQYLEQK